MKKFFASLVAILAIGIAANAANYTIDESAIDAQIEAAAEVAPMTIALSDSIADNQISLSNGNADPLIALVLDVVVGTLGIHRLYLGTKVLTCVGYIITFGGIFGILPLVDGIVLLIELINGGSGSQYVNNPKFFMWL